MICSVFLPLLPKSMASARCRYIAERSRCAREDVFQSPHTSGVRSSTTNANEDCTKGQDQTHAPAAKSVFNRLRKVWRRNDTVTHVSRLEICLCVSSRYVSVCVSNPRSPSIPASVCYRCDPARLVRTWYIHVLSPFPRWCPFPSPHSNTSNPMWKTTRGEA